MSSFWKFLVFQFLCICLIFYHVSTHSCGRGPLYLSVFKDHVPIICKQWYFVVRIVLHFDVIIFSLIKIIFVLIIYNLRIHKQAFELIVITSFKFQYCLVQYNLWLSVFISSSQSVCLWTINCKHFLLFKVTFLVEYLVCYSNKLR